MRVKLALVCSLSLLPLSGADEIQWQSWTDRVFEQARQEKKFVFLDLEAVWCHWCHVMDATTYRDPDVIGLLKERYLTVRVDADSRPDLATRYEDYGWPATVVFDGDGKEIIRRRGYIPPKLMSSILRAIDADPSPGPSITPEPVLEFPPDAKLPAALRAELEKSFLAQYDWKQAGWGTGYKYLEWDSVEYAMLLAKSGDAQAERMARQTLDAEQKLMDPVWGGLYQYSTGGVWKEPHFEKIMSVQAENLRIYSMAYRQWKDPRYLRAAENIQRFLTNFLLSPDGAFYTSQDADLIAGRHSAGYFRLDDRRRRKRGIPRVDTHVYARENGWAIEALATLYAATNNPAYLAQATKAAEWILANRILKDGGFRHDERDPAGPYLGDTLAMARAFYALYSVTQDPSWLARTEAGCTFIGATFANPDGPGFLTPASTRPQRDENVALARLANLLFLSTGKPEYRRVAENAIRYLAAPAIARRFPAASVLLVDRETAPDSKL